MVGKKVGVKKTSMRFARGHNVNPVAIRRHLGQQLGLLLPHLMKYAKSRDLEVNITAKERPWRLEFVWQRNNKKPLSALWQKRIRDMLGESLAEESNLFLFTQPLEGLTLITELRIEDVSIFMVNDHDDDDRRDPHFNNFRG